MAQQAITIAGGTPPYTIEVSEASTTEVMSCSSGCSSSNATSRTVVFSQLSGSHYYRIVVRDSSSPVCTSDQLTAPLACTTAPVYPSFDIVGVTMPTCTNGSLTNGSYTVANITNGIRYKILTTDLSNNCSGAISIPSGNQWFTISVAPPAAGTTVVYTVRLWNSTGSSCDNYTDHQVSITSPACQSTPGCNLSFTLGSIQC